MSRYRRSRGELRNLQACMAPAPAQDLTGTLSPAERGRALDKLAKVTVAPAQADLTPRAPAQDPTDSDPEVVAAKEAARLAWAALDALPEGSTDFAVGRAAIAASGAVMLARDAARARLAAARRAS